MRRIPPLYVLILAMLLSCSQSYRGEPKVIIAKSDAQDAGLEQPSEPQNGQIRPTGSRPRIVIDGDDKVLSVIDANLDQDSDLEQVIAVKRRDGVDSPVRILIADSNSAKGRYYYQSFETSTNSTSSRVFSLYLKDLVGDHGTEIVVRGMNVQGELTLDVFRKAPPATGQDLAFRAVCQIVADDITIDESERSEQYSSGQKNGESFPIYASNRDPDSRNVTDLIRVTHTWSFAENRYVAGLPGKVPGEKVAQKQLELLYSGADTGSFDSFLEGPWIELSVPTQSSPKPHVLQIINFEPNRRVISRYLGDTMEIYVWSGGNRLLFDRMLVTIEDDTFHTVARYMVIRAVSMNGIEVSIQEADLADDTRATCVRLSDEIARQYLGSDVPPVSLDSSPLSGVYQSMDGKRIDFVQSNLTWTEAGSERNGYYVCYTIDGVKAVSIRFFDHDGFPERTLDYRMEQGERREPGRTTKTLTLYPIQLTVGGYQDVVGDPISLGRIGDPPAQ